MKLFSYIIILLILIFGISFAVLNADPVTVNYYIGKEQLPLSLLLSLAFGAGLFIGIITMGFTVLRMKVRTCRYKKKLKLAEKEIDNLRVIPVKDEH